MKAPGPAAAAVLAGALLGPAGAEAGVCDPTRSSGSVSGGALCQFRFNAAGTLDALTLAITLRDAFDVPVPCSTLVEIVDAAPALCVVDPVPLAVNTLTGTGWTTEEGEALFVIDRLGGRGELTLRVLATDCCHEPWTGWVTVLEETVRFTTPDQDGSCGPAADVLDLALWAACLPPAPSCRTSDLDCDADVDVLDLGLWASGL